IRQRLLRSEQQSMEGDDVLQIDNSGAPEIAGERLLAVLVARDGGAK
ncbi:MAG: phosphonate metabolism protein/1,5-bisphosphokinase (PRPP-forming) PhnN, partial [Mesorhizobium sp.]